MMNNAKKSSLHYLYVLQKCWSGTELKSPFIIIFPSCEFPSFVTSSRVQLRNEYKYQTPSLEARTTQYNPSWRGTLAVCRIFLPTLVLSLPAQSYPCRDEAQCVMWVSAAAITYGWFAYCSVIHALKSTIPPILLIYLNKWMKKNPRASLHLVFDWASSSTF